MNLIAPSVLRVFTAILALSAVVILACAQDPAHSPTPAPTASLESTTAPAATPTARPVQPSAVLVANPTATPQPTSKATASTASATGDTRQTTVSGVITTLSRGDQEGFLSAISGIERDCLTRRFNAQRLMVLTGTPEFASPREIEDFIRCLGDETILRVLVTESISDIGQLSEGSSACIRDGLTAIDLRSSFALWLTPTETWGEDERFMGSLAAIYISNSCLNEEEFQNAAPAHSTTVEERAEMQCVLERVGGPEGMAGFEWQDGGLDPVFMGAMLQCKVRGPTAVPSPQAPVQTFATGPINPIVGEFPESLVAAFSEAELDCVTKLAGTEDLLGFLASPGPQHEVVLFDCLNDETIMRMFLGVLLQVGALSEESSACIRSGVSDMDLRSFMQSATQLEGEIDEAQAAVVDAVMIVAFACLNDEDWQAAASALGMDPSAREFFQCVMDVLGGPGGTAAILGSGDDAASANLFIASTGCGLELGLVDNPLVGP